MAKKKTSKYDEHSDDDDDIELLMPPPSHSERVSHTSERSRFAAPFAVTCVLFLLPVFAGIALLITLRIVMGMFELLAVGGGVLFAAFSFRWSIKRAKIIFSVATWGEARAIVFGSTISLGSVPASMCVSFIIVTLLLGVFWGYVVALGFGLFFVVGLSGAPEPLPSSRHRDRGHSPISIEDKRREEYEKSRTNHGRRP